MLTIIICAIFAACALFVYARFVEPSMLRVVNQTISSPLVRGQVRVLMFSDLHVGNGMDSDRLMAVAQKITEARPDVVVFLGDLFENYSKYTGGDEEEIAGILSLPDLPDAKKYAVFGNHDLGGGAKSAFEDIFEKADFTVLVNQNVELDCNINLIGGADVIFGTPDIPGLVRQYMFNLLLLHEPDYADRVANVQLQLSAHTHGGQVRLPFTKALILPQYGTKYIAGLYYKADGNQIYVTKGVGMSTLPFRFAAVPEINISTIKGDDK